GLAVVAAGLFGVQGLWTLVLTAWLGPFLGGYFILIFALMGEVVDEDERLTGLRQEARYFGTFSLAAGVGPAVAALILPWFYVFGYTVAESLGVRLVFLAAAVLAVLGVGLCLGSGSAD
ncbi:hypothetical protein, partial [Candidatus Cyanaurora vandensis]|uniref:hypothetical protein n=1 Tax=Candidatus Cyanaurora vandensis TaxID=2714958 RepID=UPI00257BE991